LFCELFLALALTEVCGLTLADLKYFKNCRLIVYKPTKKLKKIVDKLKTCKCPPLEIRKY
jgi:hypothetical protein